MLSVGGTALKTSELPSTIRESANWNKLGLRGEAFFNFFLNTGKLLLPLEPYERKGRARRQRDMRSFSVLPARVHHLSILRGVVGFFFSKNINDFNKWTLIGKQKTLHLH